MSRNSIQSITGQNPNDPLQSVSSAQLNRRVNIPAPQLQRLQRQQERTGIGSRVLGSIRWATSWVSHPIAAASVLFNYITKERKHTLDEIALAGLVYIPSETVEALIENPSVPQITKSTARDVISAGQAAYIQAQNVLKSFLLYKQAYEKEGSATSNPVVLLVMTRRLFEEILIYLVLNYRKNMLRLKLQSLVGGMIGESQAHRSLSGAALPLFPQELLDNLREIILANKALAKEYNFEVSAGVRERAELPYIRGTLSPDEDITPYEYYELMLPSIKLYEKILEQRRDVFGTEEGRVSREEMQKRLRESGGSKIDGVPSQVLTDIDDARSTVAEASSSAPASLNIGSLGSLPYIANAVASQEAANTQEAAEGLAFLAALGEEELNVNARGKRGRENNNHNNAPPAKYQKGGKSKSKKTNKKTKKNRKSTQRKRR
jgi:hypothetical protein